MILLIFTLVNDHPSLLDIGIGHKKKAVISNLLNSLFLYFLSFFRHIIFLQFQNQNSHSYIQNQVPAACYTSLYGKK